MPTSKHLAQLWERMARIYGHRWTSGMGEADDGTWAAGLDGVGAPQLAIGLRACIARPDPWPPSLPEFRALCIGLDGVDVAVDDALRDEPRSRIGQLIRASVISWDRQHLSERELRARYRTAYEQAARDYTEEVIGPRLEHEGESMSWLLGQNNP